MSDKTIVQLDAGAFPLTGDLFVVGRGTQTLSVVWEKITQDFNAKSYGAVGNGVTDDTVALQATIGAAAAVHGQIYLAPGVFKTTIDSATSLTARFVGPGQLRDSGGNLRAPWFSAITAPPSSLGDWGSVVTAFNGDVSGMQICMEHRVTGATTLGQPSTAGSYVQSPECSPIGIATFCSSGWNQSTADGSNGRTGFAAFQASMFHSGQGDNICFSGGVFVSGQKPGYTHWTANAAGGLVNGSVFAGAAGVYLNPLEFNLVDNGYDVAGVGAVINLTRTNETGAAGVLWNGVRIQSSGSKDADVGFMAVTSGAGYKVGLDLSNAALSTTGTWVSAAITLKQDQRIYFEATGTDAGVSAYRRPSSTGDSWIEYDTGINGMLIVADGVPSLQIRSLEIDSAVSINLAAGKIYQVNSTQVVQARQTGWSAPTGTLSRATFDQSTVTLPELAKRLAALVTDLTAHGLIGA